MKTMYWVVFHVKDNSGWTWSDVHGANINEEKQSTWEEYVRAHPKAWNLRNAGWPFMDTMEEVMPHHETGFPYIDTEVSVVSIVLHSN